MKVRYTPQARDDIEGIYRTIAAANPVAAQKVENRIRATVERAGQYPRTGAKTSVKLVRRVHLVRWPYTIFYRIVTVEDSIDILRVVHGARVKDLDEAPD